MQGFNKIKKPKAPIGERLRACALLLCLALVALLGKPVYTAIIGPDLPPIPSSEPVSAWVTELKVLPDGRTQISENLAVVSEGKALKHGIIRAFDLGRVDEFGTRKLSYQVDAVRRNGVVIPWKATTPAEHVQLVYLGDEKQPLVPGPYEFDFQYTVSNLVARSGALAVLSQELTPLWPVAMQQVVASIKLPKFVAQESVSIAAHIVGNTEGPYASRLSPGKLDAHVKASFYDAGRLNLSERDVLGVRFELQRPLEPYERLHVAVWWPEGFIKWPAAEPVSK
jgi:hypothetical protein